MNGDEIKSENAETRRLFMFEEVEISGPFKSDHFRVLRLYLGLDFAFLYLLIGSCLGFFMNFLSFCFALSIDHSPWNGCMLADFLTPFFLFIVEVAFALTLKVQLFTNHLIIIIIIPKNKPTNR